MKDVGALIKIATEFLQVVGPTLLGLLAWHLNNKKDDRDYIKEENNRLNNENKELREENKRLREELNDDD